MTADEDLFLEWQQGSAGALEALVRRHHAPLLAHLTRLTGDTPLAEDLVQETFLRLVREMAAFWSERGVPEQAIALYRRGLATDEVSEEFYQGLIPGYHAEGRLAEAEARATTLVAKAIAEGNVQAINYCVAQKYIETLAAFAESPNQKILLLPLEAASVIGSIAGIAEIAREAFGKDRA